MKLSIIIPVYNEDKTLETIVDKVEKVDLGKTKKELIIVNDSSKDTTKKVIISLMKKYKNIRSVEHKKNYGKGAAIRTGIKYASGEIIVIQDGDLEYNPQDFKKLLIPILKEKTKVVYGSRLLGKITGFSITSHYYGNKFLSFITGLLYGHQITDMETCYKMISKDILVDLNLKSFKFDIEPEITAKLLKKGHKILERSISYNCRSFEEGKKITWRDGIMAIFTLFKYRFFD